MASEDIQRKIEDPIGDLIVSATEQIVENAYMLALGSGDPGSAFRSAYISGIWLGLEIAVGDIQAGRRLQRWLAETIKQALPNEESGEFVATLRKTLLETP